MSEFELDARLAVDSHWIADGLLSQFRLMDDQRFAWLVLVPRRAAASELSDLPVEDQGLLLQELAIAHRLLRATGDCDKLNIGALGNIVRQLHVHVVARTVGDAAWPGPVWGNGAPVRIEAGRLAQRLAQLRALLREEGER